MKRNLVLLIFLTISVFGISPAKAQEKTVVNDVAARNMLAGRHKFAVQWIDFWKYFGTANVTNRGGVYYLKGEQRRRGGRDFVTINGIVTEINAKEFKFTGKIIISASYINQGTPCERNGEMTFKVTGNRKYWRLQEMQSPCGVETDYVDIFFR